MRVLSYRLDGRTFRAPSRSTAFVLSFPPFPPAPAEKTMLFAPVNLFVSSWIDALSRDRSSGVAPVAAISLY